MTHTERCAWWCWLVVAAVVTIALLVMSRENGRD